ncbi:MAG: peptidoglycan DD-metalloendopeptidase family protein [Chloroflexi bacterium]|nr:peptidoglycan DD-metalloendopeptidase family protein [Chloroflexota bacterium]
MTRLVLNLYKCKKLPTRCPSTLIIAVLLTLFLNACLPRENAQDTQDIQIVSNQVMQETLAAEQVVMPASQANARPQYNPGELVDYSAQSGDTLPALAVHFNTTEREIRDANPDLPRNITTLEPGLQMKIPIYYQPLWGSSYQIIPDSLFVNGPAEVGFDVVSYVASSPGWFKDFSVFASGEQLTGGQVINHIATNFSISPRLLLAILEYQTGAVNYITTPKPDDPYPLGFIDETHQGLYNQLLLAANTLNNAYYGWRSGSVTSIEYKDGRLEIPDPWQNAATVALHVYYSKTLPPDKYAEAVEQNGLAASYAKLFGDPWENVAPLIPGNLTQPDLYFPFQAGSSWAYTGGPHTGWGEGEPYAAIDFAPPSVVGGCEPSGEWVTAVADGAVVRSTYAEVVLDLDKDGNEQTGWVIYYLHLANNDKAVIGMQLKAGDPLGHPSCEGGEATGTHVHIARKYNGEWIPAGGTLAFNLEGWVVQNGSEPYKGTMVRFEKTVTACVCSDISSQIQSRGK